MNTDHVEALYGTPTTAEQEPEAELTNGKHATAEDNFGYEVDVQKTTGNPYALDQDSVTNDMYGATDKVIIAEDTDLSSIYSDPEQQEALRTNLGYMAATAGANQNDIESLIGFANEYAATGTKADPNESMASLYEQHGDGLKAKLNAAQDLVASYPELVTWLESTMLGNDSRVINKLMTIAATPKASERVAQLRKFKKDL